ncbi:MAG: SdrD B-like domain-containing protein, partial [Emticicia sp.]
MKYNFTESGIPIPMKGYSQQHKLSKVDTVLEFVQKIVNVISLFFKSKNNIMPKESMMKKPHGQIYAESSLQEYFIDKFPPQVSKNKVKSVPDLIPNQDLTMNKLSFNSNSTVKEYHLGSHFDEKLKRWTPSFSSPKRIDGENDYPKNSFFKGFATTILLVLISVGGLVAQSSIDLSLKKTVNKSLPALNESIKYTLWLKNSGPSAATSIVVKNTFPIGGAVLNTHTGGTNFTYSPITGIGIWNIPSLAVNDSVKLEINATVIQQGVFFNIAEVFSVGAGQADIDSSPNNSKLNEDDIATACFSVPLYWYPGEEYRVSVPAPYKYGSTIKWFNGTTEIRPGSTVAVVNADSSLTIKAPGTFTFVTNVTNCPAQGCCAIQIVQGPYGSIGDYVWQDINNDGKQGETTTEPPVAGVKVYLLSASNTKLDSTTTNNSGKYVFDTLVNGTYKVKFVIPTGSSITGKTLGGDPTKDSDANPDGTTDVISINTTLPVGNVGRNNTTVDAGIKTVFGSIGDYVWNDSNNNGLQDSAETGVSSIIVELYASDAIGLPIGIPLKKDTTDASGKYLFTGLPTRNYIVKVVTNSLPSGSQLTAKQDIGTNDAIDSDFNPSTGLSDKITVDLSDTTKKNILTVDCGIYSPLGSIGDFVWKDTNNNGLQDTGEVGVEGVKLELYASDALGNPIGAATNTTTTNTNGFYTFNNLPKGDYVIRIVTSTLPATSQFSSKVNAGDDTKDSDFNPTSGYSPKISIDPFVATLKDNQTIDGAIYLPVVCAELVTIAVDADICSGDTTSI